MPAIVETTYSLWAGSYGAADSTENAAVGRLHEESAAA
jgi:hypothetical protein